MTDHPLNSGREQPTATSPPANREAREKVLLVQTPTRRLTLPFTTWFGLSGRVTAGADGLHVAEVGRLRLPHPGLVNMALRPPGPLDDTLRLIVLHERGHFETAPAAALHLLWIVTAALRYRSERPASPFSPAPAGPLVRLRAGRHPPSGLGGPGRSLGCAARRPKLCPRERRSADPLLDGHAHTGFRSPPSPATERRPMRMAGCWASHADPPNSWARALGCSRLQKGMGGILDRAERTATQVDAGA